MVLDLRTNVVQSLHAILVAELTDNDGWELLVELAAQMGLDEIAREFEGALVSEQRHLDKVRRWVAALALGEALGVEEEELAPVR